MSSETKASILQRHKDNELLNTAIPSVTMRDSKDLSADELLMPLDERIIATAAEALESGQTHYVDVPGIGPLREALAEFLNSSTGTSFQTANVLVTAGVQESRFLTLQLIGEQFESIAIPSVVHPGVRKTLGVRPMTISELATDSQTMLPTLESISGALAGGTRLLYLESPSRLTGAAYSAEDVAAIAELVRKHDGNVIWDQGLGVWAEAAPSLAGEQGMAERVAVLGEAWPGMGLAGWFIGYIAAPEAWIAPMQSQKQVMAICTSTASQYAALEASKLFAEAHVSQQQQLSAARQALADATDLDVLPGAAVNVLAVRAENAKSLESAGYHVADGAAFGAPGVVRLTVTTDQTAQDAIKQLA